MRKPRHGGSAYAHAGLQHDGQADVDSSVASVSSSSYVTSSQNQDSSAALADLSSSQGGSSALSSFGSTLSSSALSSFDYDTRARYTFDDELKKHRIDRDRRSELRLEETRRRREQ